MIVYKTTNLVDGKIYVGKVCGNNAKYNSYLGSGTHLNRAIEKYGKENFNRTTIDIAEDKENQNLKEIFWINFYNSKNPNIGYNIQPGGEGNGITHSEETKRKMSDSAKKRDNSGRKSKKVKTMSKETIEKIRQKAIGRKPTEETRQKLSKSHLGHKHSDETKQKIGIASKNRHKKFI
jgi:group I intron endonuclease